MHKNNIYYKAYNLVQNLNQEERTHIRKKLTANLPNHRCIKLFDTLINMKYYDAEEIKGLFNNAVKISTATHTLIEQIIHYLQFFAEEKLIRVKINNYASAAEILMSKGASELALDAAKDGLALSLKHDLKLEIAKFNLWIINHSGVQASNLTIQQIEEKSNYVIQTLSTAQSGVSINYLRLMLAELLSTSITILDHKAILDKQIEKILSDFSDNYFSYIKKNYYATILIESGEWEKAHTIINEILTEAKNKKIDLNIDSYFSFNFAALRVSLLLGNTKDYLYYKNIINRLYDANDIILNLFYVLKMPFLFYELLYYSLLNKNISGNKLLEDAEDYIKNENTVHKHDVAKLLFIYYFFEKDFDRVISLIIRETNSANYTTMSKKQIYIMRWIEVICYFETKEKQLFNNRALILKRFIEKHRPLNTVEKTLFRFMKSNIDKKQIPADDIAECLAVLKTDEKVVRASFSEFSLFKWLQQKQQ